MTLGIFAAFVYGTLALIGGIMGYVQAQSKVSLISGSISGLLIVFAAFMQLNGQFWGLLLAIVVTAALVVFFCLRLVKTRKFMPSGLMASLGMVALVLMIK
ncbi:hypothetical protein H6G33_02725 [Calothrix sp. FACHB-1219]|uniref:TMEM14 family protein n=1 Tax=unclassified Calothrix TaxID=2619626 RepID=UPI001689BF00|nr:MULTISPECIES: TMEM14 family protein [unclassified Calothrix]MBD2201518.1 hypothetical protein [Calothrix sp. FACHB-168]MBD2215950.1 hypothetical protein [Calothrix sp. FACHB-1219]